VETLDSGNSVYQSATTIAGSIIVSTAFSASTAAPASLVAGVVGTATITFTSAVTIPIGSKIRITFPTEYGIASDAISALNNVDSASTIAYSGQVVTITIATAAISASASVSVTVSSC
jgi:hypothetical protein